MFSKKKNNESYLEKELLVLKEEISQLTKERDELLAEANERKYQSPNLGGEQVNFQQLFQNMQLFSDSFMAVQSSLAEISGHMELESDQAQKASEISAQTRNSVSDLTKQLSNMTSGSLKASDRVGSLNRKAEEIGGIVNMIKSISEQTNLLALNAAIEAARAGEMGRGFAVVADEVRNLAARAGEATSEIEELVLIIQQETESATNQMNQFVSESSNYNDKSDEVTDNMSDLLSISEKMKLAISSSAMHSFTELAKFDHLIYKFEIYRIFMGISNKRPEDFSDHTTCRLGKWYAEKGSEQYGKNIHFRELESPHRQVHEYGTSAIEAYYKKNYNDGIQYIEKMEKASQQVIEVLDALVD